jgi:hypothetical protein
VNYHEDLSVRPKQLWWLPGVLVAGLFGMGIYAVPVVLVSFLFQLVRYRRATVAIDNTHLWAGKRSIPLSWLDAASIGHSRNRWPWHWTSRRRIACVPFWTKSSLGVAGQDNTTKRVHVSVGTNNRDALLSALVTAIQAAPAGPPARAGMTVAATATASAGLLRQHQTPAAGWYPDPWDPSRAWRWFDGASWTAWTAPAPRIGSRGV